LAKAGIQNVVDLDDAPRRLTARLSAAEGESAVQRVRSALEGEAFTVEGDVRLEHGPSGQAGSNGA
jgi:hypothetical protein